MKNLNRCTHLKCKIDKKIWEGITIIDFEIFGIVVISVQAAGRVRHHDVAVTCGEKKQKIYQNSTQNYARSSASLPKKNTLSLPHLKPWFRVTPKV